MNQTELIKAIDEDINKHHLKASDMLGVIWFLFFVIGVIFTIYIVPGIAERARPDLEKDAALEKSEHVMSVSKYEAMYKKQYISISKDEFEKLIKSGNVNDEVKTARLISKTDENISSSSWWLKLARALAKLKVEDSKIESILKILPYAIGAILAGFLVTYRLHVVSAKELAIKKFEIFSKILVDEIPKNVANKNELN
jgi:hypothetical protein